MALTIPPISAVIDGGICEHLIISVAPRDALGIADAGLGKTPALPDDEPGYWKPVPRWQHGITDKERNRAIEAGANAGLILGVPLQGQQYIALDFDLLTGTSEEDFETKVALAIKQRSIRTIVSALAGNPIWVRDSRPGRAAVLFRMDPAQPTGRKDIVHLTSSKYGDVGKIEVLARGQQIVIAGEHSFTQQPLMWWRSDRPDVRVAAPTVDEAIPVLKDRENLNKLLELILTSLTGWQITGQRSRTASDLGNTLPQIVNAEDQAPPSGDILVRLLERLPHDSRVDHEDYVLAMHATVGCIRALKELGRTSDAEVARISAAAVKWAASWRDPKGKGTTLEKELKKWKTDWAVRPDIHSGWYQLMNLGVRLGLEDLRVEEGWDTFEALEPAPVHNPLYTEPKALAPIPTSKRARAVRSLEATKAEMEREIGKALKEPLPSAANAYLSSDALADPNRPRARNTENVLVQQADTSLADAIEKTMVSRAIYLENEKRWIVWQGPSHAWSHPAGERVVRSWIEAGLTVQAQKHFQQSPDSLIAKVLSASRIDAMEKILRTRLGRTLGDEVTNRFLVQTPVGAFNLTNGKMLSIEEQRDMVEMRRTDAIPEAVPTPNFDAVMSLMCGEDDDVVEWLWHYMGYLMLGHPIGHNLLVIHGPGGNGKGAFCRTIQKAMGTYAIEANRDLIIDSGKKQHKTSLYDLKGKRYWFISEISPGEQWNEAQVKSLTGGDRIQANKMHRDMSYFNSEGTFIIATNNMPKFTKVDDAILRRFFVIAARLKPKQKDLLIEEKIVEGGELRGILYKMMQYAQIVYQNGFKLPATPVSMNRETNRYFNEQDIFFAWCRSETEPGVSQACGVPLEKLKTRYDEYVRRHTISDFDAADPLSAPALMSNSKFAAELRRTGCAVETVRMDDGRMVTMATGIRMKSGLTVVGAEDFEVVTDDTLLVEAA